jgi:hypothetical protein
MRFDDPLFYFWGTMPIIMAIAVYVGLFYALIFAAMKLFKIGSPRVRRVLWNSAIAIFLVLGATLAISMAMESHF